MSTTVQVRELAILDEVMKGLPNVLPAVEIDASEPFERWPEEVTQQAGTYALLFSRSAGNPKVEPSPTVSAPVLMSFTFAPLPSPRVRSV